MGTSLPTAVHRGCRSDRSRSIGRAKQRQPIGTISRHEALNLAVVTKPAARHASVQRADCRAALSHGG